MADGPPTGHSYEALRDSLRFSVRDDGRGRRFEWVRFEGIPESRRVNEALQGYFAERPLREVDCDKVGRLLVERRIPDAEKMARIVREYCEFLGRR